MINISVTKHFIEYEFGFRDVNKLQTTENTCLFLGRRFSIGMYIDYIFVMVKLYFRKIAIVLSGNITYTMSGNTCTEEQHEISLFRKSLKILIPVQESF